MDRPAGGDHSLLISHDNMPCLLWFSHIVHNKGILRQIKIQIHFHPSVMGVAGHGVPHTSRFQACHSHFQLAALHLSRKNIFADGPVVGLLQTSQFHLVLLFYDYHVFLRRSLTLYEHCGIRSVGRRTVDVELGGIFLICTGKCDISFSHANVHAFPRCHFKGSAVNTDAARTSDIDHAHLTSLKEIFRS